MTIGLEIVGGILALLASIHMMILSRLVTRLDRLQVSLDRTDWAIAQLGERIARLEAGRQSGG